MYSDGLVEAHDPSRAMFGFPRLAGLVAALPREGDVIECLLAELAAFTGPDWEQEDDVTLVTLQRTSPPTPQPPPPSPVTKAQERGEGATGVGGEVWQTLADFSVASQPGNEREALKRVAESVQSLGLPEARVERLKTAVAEATMNAIEHGNRNRADLPVRIEVRASAAAVLVRITDQGGGRPIPEAQTPDLEAKLAGLQTPRGWGLFLIEEMVDAMRVLADDSHHTVELTLNREEN